MGQVATEVSDDLFGLLAKGDFLDGVSRVHFLPFYHEAVEVQEIIDEQVLCKYVCTR